MLVEKRSRHKIRDSNKSGAGNQGKKDEGFRFRTLINLDNNDDITAADNTGIHSKQKGNGTLQVTDKSQDFRPNQSTSISFQGGICPMFLIIWGLKIWLILQ